MPPRSPRLLPAVCLLIAGALALGEWRQALWLPSKSGPVPAPLRPEVAVAWPRADGIAFVTAGAPVSAPADLVRGLSGEARDAAEFARVWQRWSAQSPADALAWLLAQPDHERWRFLRDAAVTDWARREPEAALRWALSRPEAEQPDLLASLAAGFAGTDPMLALAFVAELLPPGQKRQQALDGIAVAWARHDPAAAATWALGADEADARRETLGLVLYPWFDYAPTAVEGWVDRLPDAGERDAIRVRLVGWQVQKNPAEAGVLVAKISDEALRTQAAANLVRRWARDDFDVAGEWVLRGPSTPLRAHLVAELDAIARERADPYR